MLPPKNNSAYLTLRSKSGKFLDPLGLFTKEEIKRLKTQDFCSYKNEQFSFKLFIKVYREKSYSEIKQGLSLLEEKLAKRNNQMETLVSERLGNFIGGKESIDQVSKDLVQLKKQNEGLLSKDDVDDIQSIRVRIRELFESIVAEKRSSDMIARSLTIIQKYKQIFFLPSVIESDIKKNDYKRLIYDYKVSNVYKKKLSKVRVFEKIFVKIDNIVQGFSKRILNGILCEVDAHKLGDVVGKEQVFFYSGNVKRKIRYLVHLNCLNRDPNAFFIEKFELKILNLLKKVNQKYQKRMREEVKSNLNIINSSLLINKMNLINLEYISLLTKVLVRCFPDFLNLCLENDSKIDNVVDEYHKFIKEGLSSIDNNLSHQKLYHQSILLIFDSCTSNIMNKYIDSKYAKYLKPLKKLLKEFKFIYVKDVLWKRTINELNLLLHNSIDDDLLTEYVKNHILKTIYYSSSNNEIKSLNISKEGFRRSLEVISTTRNSLKNIYIIKDKIYPYLINEFEKRFKTKVDFKFDTKVINFIMNSYLKSRMIKIIKLIESGLLLSGFNWECSTSINDADVTIRDFIHELLLELALIHSDVEKIGDKELTKLIFVNICERISELFWEFILEIDNFSLLASFQIDVEMSFVRKSLSRYENEKIEVYYEKILKFLKNKSKYKQGKFIEKKEAIMLNSLRRTTFQLSCFKN